MKGCIGIRQENKDITEQRAALTPAHVHKLVREHQIRVLVEPAQNRIFPDTEFRKAGAAITDNLKECNIIFGVKEVPVFSLLPGQNYFFFSHTIKGQPYNMPMLKSLLDLRNTLLDYELVTGPDDRRLIFFGKFAGYAGMIDSLWSLGMRLQWEGFDTPFSEIRQALNYENLNQAKAEIEQAGKKIEKNGLPPELVPFICGFTGYGHVSQGAQEIFDYLPHEKIPASDLVNFMQKKKFSDRKVYKVVFGESDMVQLKKSSDEFDLQDYYEHPEKYQSIFRKYLPHLTVLINGIYWEPRYPKLVTRQFLKNWFEREAHPRLRVIGDITCDINGSIECTMKATNSRNPIYVYNPFTDSIQDGHEGQGVVVLAVDKLPSELPREASDTFGEALLPFVPELAHADFSLPYDQLTLPKSISGAIIVHRGHLTPGFRYLSSYLKKEMNYSR